MPFLFPLIGLVVGILTTAYFPLPIWGPIGPISAALSLYLLILKKSILPTISLKINKFHNLWIFLLFVGIGMVDMEFQKPTFFQKETLGKYILAEGEIRECQTLTSGDRFIVDVYRMTDTLSCGQKYRNFHILLYTEGLSASIGDIISFPTKFQPITDNPNLRPTGFAERMNKFGIYYQSNVKEGDVRIIGFNSTLLNTALAHRERLIALLEKSTLSRPVCDFLTALLLGDRAFLSEDVRIRFSNAGVAHVLALSGLHIAILMGIMLFLLFPLKIARLYRLRYMIAVAMLWIFVYLTGLAPSTIRAALMTTFVVVALISQRRNGAENSLLAAVFIILLFKPMSLFDIGLQLSVLCVGSILIFAGPLNPINHRAHPYLHSVTAAILVSIISTATTWVVTSYYFHTIPLLFLPVNLCLLPLLPLYIWIAILYIFLLKFNIDSSFLSFLLNKGYDYFNWIVTRLSCFGQSSLTIDIQWPVMLLWLLGVLILAFALKNKTAKKRLLIVGAISFFGLSIVSIPILNKKEPDSIIFQKDFNKISLALYEGRRFNIAAMPRNSVSRITHKNSEIISIDSKIDIDSVVKILSGLQSRKGRKYLILGGGFRDATLKDLPYLNEYKKIILHSSLKKRMENQLRKEALELGLNTLHSLREDGPLEELLFDSLPDNI